MHNSDELAGMLRWNCDHGFFPVTQNGVYDESYFQKYVGYANTEMGKAILKGRLEFVSAVIPPYVTLIDVGIGCGQFVEARRNTRGYDVNPSGVAWLQHRKLFHDISYEAPAMSFWDSMEHIEDPMKVLDKCVSVAFASVPIFRDKAHALQSRHFRPDEHFWYWTEKGFIRHMGEAGFRLLERSDFETQLGREDILSFAFRRGV